MTTKEHAMFTIDIEILKEFKGLAKEMAINKSALVEKMMKNWIQEQKNK